MAQSSKLLKKKKIPSPSPRTSTNLLAVSTSHEQEKSPNLCETLVTATLTVSYQKGVINVVWGIIFSLFLAVFFSTIFFDIVHLITDICNLILDASAEIIQFG
ncbi:hypothetical protein ACJX0J_014149 [Zea mays]